MCNIGMLFYRICWAFLPEAFAASGKRFSRMRTQENRLRAEVTTDGDLLMRGKIVTEHGKDTTRTTRREQPATVRINADGSVVRPRSSSRMEGDVARGSIGSDGLWFMGRRRESSFTTPSPTASSETVTITANELDFIKISKDIYRNSMNVEGLDQCWERNPSAEVEADFFGGKDHIALYTCKCERCQNQCALSFSGTNDLTDMANNIARGLAQRTFCGLEGINDGFVEELKGVSDHVFWRDSVLPMLRSPECSTINAVGHSLGGAMAAIFAACVNCPTCEKPEAFEGIESEVALWTTGAPQVSLEPLTNGRSSDGTFKGRRFWNFHDRDYWLFKSQNVDLVPSAPGIMGYKHPKMESVGLDMDHNKDIDTSADDADEADIPFGLPFMWDIRYHLTGAYTENAAAHSSDDGVVNKKRKDVLEHP